MSFCAFFYLLPWQIYFFSCSHQAPFLMSLTSLGLVTLSTYLGLCQYWMLSFSRLSKKCKIFTAQSDVEGFSTQLPQIDLHFRRKLLQHNFYIRKDICSLLPILDLVSTLPEAGLESPRDVVLELTWTLLQTVWTPAPL